MVEVVVVVLVIVVVAAVSLGTRRSFASDTKPPKRQPAGSPLVLVSAPGFNTTLKHFRHTDTQCSILRSLCRSRDPFQAFGQIYMMKRMPESERNRLQVAREEQGISDRH